LGEARVIDGERALDADGFLVLCEEEAHRDHEKRNQDPGEDSMVPRPVLPMRSFLPRHSVCGHRCNSNAASYQALRAIDIESG